MKNVRLKALECILEITGSSVLPKNAIDLKVQSFNSQDRAFLSELTYGSIRYRDAIDWMAFRFLKNPQKLGKKTLNNIRLAVYQIMFMKTPDHAAVYETVEIEKKLPGGKPSLVNGVLRNIIRNKANLALPDDNTPQSLSIRTSTPLWIVKRWIRRYGHLETEALCRENNSPPPMTLRVNRLAASLEEISSELDKKQIPYRKSDYFPSALVLNEHLPYSEIAFLQDKVMVQDEASQLAGLLVSPEAGDLVLDACAAPGTKTNHMAELADDNLLIAACDQRIRRCKKILDNKRTFKLNSIRAFVGDSENVVFRRSFDKILLDAPCSSFGTIRKNPDIKYKHKGQSLQLFKEKQIKLLANLSKYLKKDGLLVYCVCSTEPEEGEEVVAGFLKRCPEFYNIEGAVFIKQMKDKYEMDINTFKNGSGSFRTYPHVHGMDGFFFAGFGRK